MRVGRIFTPDTAHNVALPSVRVTLLEGEPVGQIFDGISIEIDLEFVHAFGMVAGRRNRPKMEWQRSITNTVRFLRGIHKGP